MGPATLMISAPLLDIASLNVSIEDRAVLQDVSMQLWPGEILGVVGASGSGKSMTALAIMRLLPPAAVMSGTILLNGESLPVRGKTLGMVFQEPTTALNPLMRIDDQVAEALRIHADLSKPEALKAAQDVLGQTGLPASLALGRRLPYQLSGGQRQRVAIAMAVANSPPLLIADEPTTALDVITQSQVFDLLRTLARSRNMALMLITHDLAVVSQMADRVVVMQQGRIVDQGERRTSTTRIAATVYTRVGAGLATYCLSAVASRTVGAMVLEVSNVVCDYRRPRRHWRPQPPLRAVDHVCLTVNAGETVGLVGASGSGKTSLLRVILGLDRPQGGTVTLSGAARGRLTQAVFQDPYGSFDPRWRVERLIAEPFFSLDQPPALAEQKTQSGRGA